MRNEKSDNVKTPVITDLTAKYQEDALDKLTPARIKTFKADKGYGFFDTPTGDVFFHVSRFVELKADMETLSQAWQTPRGEDGKVVVPELKSGIQCLIRVEKNKDGKNVAGIWAIKKQVTEQRTALDAELARMVAVTKVLPILELEVVTVTRGEPRADNVNRCFVSDVSESRKVVFCGNNLTALLEAIGYHGRRANYLICYDATDVKNRVRIPLPACKHLEYPS